MKNKKNVKKEEMDVVFSLDRSGSMNGMEDDTIGGYNSYLDSLKGKNINVTTILFDDKYEMITEREKLEKVKKLNRETYYVRGCTALLDAIGKTINYLNSKKPNKVLFIITTDGLENASKEFSKDKIKEMINHHSDWEFMYIGADIDSYSEGESIGIKRCNIANYKKSNKGVSKLFSSIGYASKCMYEECCINEDWKNDLERYVLFPYIR